MATASAPASIPTPATQPPLEDIVQRHLKRVLPCKLDREELTDIAIDAAKKRRRLRELEADLEAEKKRRKQQIDELQTELNTHDRELDTEEQDRVVLCDLLFRSGMVYTRRRDTGEEFESRPATAQEAQRFLPAVESALTGPLSPSAPLLDQAAAAQGRAGSDDDAEDPGEDDGVPDGADSENEDDGLSDPPADETPAQRAARESAEARAARRAAGKNGKRGRGGKGGAK